MLVIRYGGIRLVAQYQETDSSVSKRKTGLLVDLTEALGGDLVANPHVGTALLASKPDGMAYLDPTTMNINLLRNGRANQLPDEFVDTEWIVCVTSDFWGLTDQVEDGDYANGNLVGPSVNGKLKVVTSASVTEGSAVALGKVLKGATVTSSNRTVEVLLNLAFA